jgi:hypothetical protein
MHPTPRYVTTANGIVIGEIRLPASVDHLYSLIEPYRNDRRGCTLPVSLVVEVRALGVQHFAVFDDDVCVREFKSAQGGVAFEDACRCADDLGKPWMESGGSEVFDPQTRRCWSQKTLFPILKDRAA